MFSKKLVNNLKSNVPITWIDSFEEARLENTIRAIVASDPVFSEYNLYRWSFTDGLKEIDKFGIVEHESKAQLANFATLFNFLTTQKDKNLIVMMHISQEIVNDYRFIRALRDLKEYNNNVKLIFITPFNKIPTSIEKLVYKVDFELLERGEVSFFISKLIDQKKESLLKERILRQSSELNSDESIDDYKLFIEEKFSYLDNDYLDKLINASLGLTSREILFAFNLSFEKNDRYVVEDIYKQKIQQVEKSGVLEFIVPKTTFKDIGGNHAFKDWIEEIKYTFDPKARQYNIPQAKGHLALGIPGTSKTFSAEALAGELNLPLLKLSSDKIFSRLVGESEKNISQAFKVAQACSPCILLIDEIEKTLSGTGSSNSSDAGTSARVFATILENLNDPKGVYTVMTSNDITQLPPEITRIGRVDALWYFSLPKKDEREEIVNIHLRKNDLTIDQDKIDLLVNNTNNYTGAELEQIVINMNRKSFIRMMKDNLDSKTIEDEDILNSINEVNPLYNVHREKILILENTMKGRVRNSSGEKKDNPSEEINLEDLILK